jgi:hypothetical protein
MAGKGDKPRPVNKKIYDKNFDDIKWNSSKKEEIKIKSKTIIKY